MWKYSKFDTYNLLGKVWPITIMLMMRNIYCLCGNVGIGGQNNGNVKKEMENPGWYIPYKNGDFPKMLIGKDEENKTGQRSASMPGN